METKKIISIIAYLVPLWIVGLFVEKDDPDVKFHVNQGVCLTIVSVASGIVLGILANVFIFVLPGLFFIYSILSYVVYLAIFVLVVLGCMNAYKGEQKELPFIGGFKIIK